jgi:hypothetical protein
MTASRGRFVPIISGPSNGKRPHSIANRMTPNDQTSNGGPAFAVPRKTSGARKDNVPQLDFINAPGR